MDDGLWREDRDQPFVGLNELPSELHLEILVRDPDAIETLCEHPEGESREEFALSALRIGLLALRRARGQIDADVIRNESQRMLTDLQSQLAQHSKSVQQRLGTALHEYFDPQSGRFHQRIEQLVRSDGELEQVMRRQVSGDDSQLVRTLVQHVGRQSPLFKMLDPNQSQGLLATLHTTLDKELAKQRERVLAEFSLDNKQGALCRFMEELSENQGDLTKNLQDKIDVIVKEFSLDEENSALSRLVRNVDRAQRTISSEFSLDNEESAFSRMRTMLEQTREVIHQNLTLDDEKSSLSRLKRELMDIIKEHAKTNREFQEDVKLTLGQMIARKKEADRGTRHGLEFEDAVCEYLQQAAIKANDICEHTGNSTGLVKHCKVGDCVLTLGPESAAPEAKVVIEAKEDGSYNIAKARAEIEIARKNRGAQVGLFVFSAKIAPTMEPVMRLGHDVFVAWDAEDSGSDIYFWTALTLARALCVQSHKQTADQSVDFQEITKALLDIEKHCNLLGDIEKWSDSIKSSNEKIRDRVRKSRSALERQVSNLQERMEHIHSTLGERS